MNTKQHTHQIRTATLATVIAFVAFAGTTAPAFATHTHDDGEGGAGTTALPPYAVPIDGSRRNHVGGVHREAPRRRPPHPHRGVTRPACPEQDTAPDIGRGPCAVLARPARYLARTRPTDTRTEARLGL